MGLYAKYVLPRVIDVAMRNKETTALRAAWIPRARGEVLEVGIGSGLNLPFYSAEVEQVYGVDPSVELQQMARQRASTVQARIQFLTQSAESPIPLKNESIDTVVVTWAMCSIPNVSEMLKEARRVLRSEGRLIFLEHGRSPDAGTAAWQDRITPVWKRITGGCHLNRKVDDLLTTAGFRIAELETGYLTGPHAMTYTYQGVADPV